MSFFDDDDEETLSTAPRQRRTPPRPAPRRAQHPPSTGGPDQHTLMVRRRIAAAVGVALVVIIVLVVNGCLKSKAQAALETYSEQVQQMVRESDEQVSRPLFSALSNASSQQPLNVEVQVDQLRLLAQTQADRARSLSTPSKMSSAQRNFLLMMNLRAEGMAKVANLVRTALGGQSTNASTQIAGDMQMFLASDVLYSQRVAPLVSQTLAANSATGQISPTSQFLPNLGWLDPSTVQTRITGQSSSSGSSGTVAPGTHGHSLLGVSVGSSALEAEPTLNHVKAGPNPTFMVKLENGGENLETNVKVDVVVTSQGKQYRASHTINRTEPGKSLSVDIPVEGVPVGSAARVTVEVHPVPGESNAENNKQSYLAIFEG